jgi:indole-3-glycerol phosphate synthase
LIETVPDILARIVARKRQELPRTIAALDRLEQEAERQRLTRRDFRAALQTQIPAVIAEVKKASPSKGLLSGEFDPVRIARQYEAGGAAAISVLTDEHFFQGTLADLRHARGAVSVPALRKDFTISPAHVVEAAANGADAILLIAAILSEREIREFRERAARYGMAALVEVHSRRELEVATAAGSDVIGVNNRDLSTFQVTLETSLELAAYIPGGVVRVSESGIFNASHVQRLRKAGYHALLVGEHLMRSGDAAAALRALVSE